MDPNSSPWAYAYNRIVPSTSGSNEDFQHPHLATISAAAGTSAQSLLLQAAHTGIAGFNATSGNFVPPSPIGGYNPVFQQIYHQAAQAVVQPKPAHYASSTVSTTHRHIGICGIVEKHDSCRSHTTSIGYQSNQTNNISATAYYGENSSSSGASPSPTTSVTSATTLTWNAPAIDSSQQMPTNAFISMQQQQPAISPDEKVNNAKHSIPHTKAQSKIYGDLIYVGSDGQQPEQVTLHLDNQIVQDVSEGNCSRPENGFYTFVDGKLTYNIPAAAINSCLSPSNKLLPGSSIKSGVTTTRKESSGESQQPSTHQHCFNQISSPVYSIYESPSVCSSVDSPPQPIKSVHNNEGDNNLGQNILYKSNPNMQTTSINNSNVGRGASSNNSSNNYTRNGVGDSSLSSITGVAYSSVITNALQSQQQQLLENHHPQEPDCWPSTTTVKPLDTNKQNQRCYTAQSPPVQEGSIYTLSSSLQVKHVLIEQNLESANSSEPSSQLEQQIINNTLHVMTPQVEVDKHQSQPVQQSESRLINQSRQHSIENVIIANNSLASQIQCTTKAVDVQKAMSQKKTPRKRQPKKTVLTNNEFARVTQQATTSNIQSHQSQSIHHHQTPQPMHLSQQNSPFFDYSTRWMPQKNESGESSQFMNNQHSNLIPQPAHTHPSSTHTHMSHISQYFPTLPQVSTQYTCMTQNSNLYITPASENGTEDQHNPQQNPIENHCSLQQRNALLNIQEQSTTPISTYKVIVPNIEDELNFLSTMDLKSPNNTFNFQEASNLKNSLQNHSSKSVNTYKAFENRLVVSKKSGFMDSYLKFLQGERDESPPPILKSIRKFSYQKPVTQSECSIPADKRKSSETIAVSIKQSSAEVENPAANINNPLCTANTPENSSDNGHKIKIISQTQILPKKRPHVQNISGPQQSQLTSKELPQKVPELQEQQNHLCIKQNQQEAQQSNEHQDPLALPGRREQSLRKAKSRSINGSMESSIGNDREESVDFADSDTDPVWTPEDDIDDGRILKCGNKRRVRCIKNPSSSKKGENTLKDVKVITEIDNTGKTSHLPTRDKIISEVTNLTTPDNFKTGDFIVLRSDLVNDWPIIWQVDSKCILQKYEPYCQNGKMFYRNMSKYASWNLDTKKLYLKAPVRIQIQSHAETIVEFMRTELLADDTEQFIEKMMEEYLTYRDHFEIYIQTMISQVLDPSFFSEINREKDEYFLSSVRIFDEIMENCKRKLLSITPWTRSVILSIETWPQCHVFTEWGQNNVNQKNCGGCHQPGISVRFLLFGHPYNSNTMQTIPVDMRVSYEKDILLCRICAARADIFHKIAHEKYNIFSICTRRVGEHQKENPEKGSTDILNDLLAENNWVDELFRNMRSSWAEVESLERQKRFHEVSQ